MEMGVELLKLTLDIILGIPKIEFRLSENGAAMGRNLSDTVEDYLKTIYKLSEDQGRVGTGLIAHTLGVSPASATDMVQR